MNKRNFLEGLLAAAGFTSAFFLFLPLVVYMLNLGSVTTSKTTILLCGGLLAAVSTGVLAAAMCVPLIGRWIFAGCQIGLIAVVLLTVFPNRTGEITGFSHTPVQNLLVIAKNITVCTVGIWLARKKPQTLMQLSYYAGAVVVAVCCYVALVPVSTADRSPQQLANPPASFTQLGQGKNVVVVIFDCQTGYRMTEVLAAQPRLREELAGFVYYPAAIASAVSTPAGVSAILTGDLKISLMDEEWGARTTASLKGSFLADAKRKGFTTGFISNLCPSDSEIYCVREDAFFPRHPLNSFNRLPAYLGFYSSSLTRIAPRQVESLVSSGTKWIMARLQAATRSDWDLLQTLQTELERRPQASKMAMNHFIDNLQVISSQGSVLVLHSMMTHPPYKLAADGRYLSASDNEYESTSLYAARQLARLCDKLRSLGVYDSTLIIAVADHGGSPIRDATMGGLSSIELKRQQLHHNPLVMIKPPGAHAPCRDSAMSVWIGDVAATVRDFIGLSDVPGGMFATRSLLLPDLPGRSVNVPVFVRPEQVDFYASLAKWRRMDINGTFRDYLAGVTETSRKKE